MIIGAFDERLQRLSREIPHLHPSSCQRVKRRGLSRLPVMAFVKKLRQLYRRHDKEEKSVNSQVGHSLLRLKASDHSIIDQ